MRSILSVFLLVCVNGCVARGPELVPEMPPISRISGRLLEVPDFNLKSSKLIEVPEDQIDLFARLVWPKSECLQQIGDQEHYHVADVMVEHSTGATSTLIVRWTGHNPAAVSLDGQTYYYGGRDEFPDGATKIVRLLGEYEYNANSTK